ncbi:HPF/RaiA family ribosome-associated protein [Candidatus Dojkabacteria bacterium]|uniref:HPF/RaiA family ribosome-associated protein n=1 Tax=Candidatus Dojkabacteria bacterium TaxID=2099670 RepID=A0A955I7M7_9BACT|nr:HPF/RaiA family ribosome-associated protein [Candidatus Dojkabacteria bacterium]
MQLLFSAPSLTAPTFETLREYGSKRFEKLARVLPQFNGEPLIKVSVQKEGRLFVVHVEVAIPKVIVVTMKDADLRKAIDYAYATLKKTVVRQVEKARGR